MLLGKSLRIASFPTFADVPARFRLRAIRNTTHARATTVAASTLSTEASKQNAMHLRQDSEGMEREPFPA